MGGADALPARERRREKSADAPTRREGRSLTRDEESSGRGESMDVEGSGGKRQKATSVPRDRSSLARDAASVARSRSPSANGLRDEKAMAKVQKLAKKKGFQLSKQGRASESDRRIPTIRPKHLNSGKRGIGKTDRR